MVLRLGRPLVGDERVQTRLATGAPAQVELGQLVAALAIARRPERAEDPLARVRAPPPRRAASPAAYVFTRDPTPRARTRVPYL